jgi:hypothetical protein
MYLFFLGFTGVLPLALISAVLIKMKTEQTIMHGRQNISEIKKEITSSWVLSNT